MAVGHKGLRLARTEAEAHLFMEMNPCACGENEFDPGYQLVLVDGVRASRYAGPCPGCSQPREFSFRLPEQVIFPAEDAPAFGGERESELLDAGEWLWFSDVIANGLPAEPDMVGVDQWPQVRIGLRTAAAAADEAAKFLGPDGGELPDSALWTDRGRAAHAEDPERFRLDRLHDLAQAYRDLAERFTP